MKVTGRPGSQYFEVGSRDLFLGREFLCLRRLQISCTESGDFTSGVSHRCIYADDTRQVRFFAQNLNLHANLRHGKPNQMTWEVIRPCYKCFKNVPTLAVEVVSMMVGGRPLTTRSVFDLDFKLSDLTD